MGAIRILLFFLCSLVSCWAKRDGAPNSACDSLTPLHSGISPQQSSPLYSVSAVKIGNKVRVKISSAYGEEFKGFVLQARSSRDKTRLVDGTFTHSQESKAIDCFKGKQNTLTHVNPDSKSEVTTEWTPSGMISEDVVFRATVAKTYALFWTNIDSTPVAIQNNGGSRPEADGRMGQNSNPMTDGCSTSKSCFAYPSGCIFQSDCEILLSFSKVSNGIRFQLHGYLENQMYIAMALSNDGIMGDDSVTECFREDSIVYARESYNEGKRNTETRDLSRDQYEGSYNNGLLTCSWTAPFIIQANGKRYDLANNRYYALIAKGPMTNRKIGYHSVRVPSADAINFTALEAIEDASASTSVKIHGITDESTSLLYSPTVFFTGASTESAIDASTEAKSTLNPSTAEANGKKIDTNDKNDSLQLSFNHVFLLALLELIFYASGGHFIM